MKRTVNRLGMFLVGSMLMSAAQAATLSITPGSQDVVGIGTSFDVSIEISGLGDGAAPSLGAYDITLSFDDALLTLAETVFDNSQLDFGLGAFSQSTTSGGSVNLIGLSFENTATLDSQQASTFTLAVLTFQTQDYGTTLLDFGTVVLADSFIGSVDFSTVSAEVSVNVVPIPGAVLFPSALLVLGFLRRRSLRSSFHQALT